MTNPQTEFIDVARLRIGHYVFIDVNWISHPFPLNSFKIHSDEQIGIIRSLGIDRIRYSPQRSDPDPVPAVIPARGDTAPVGATPPGPAAAADALRREALAEQRSSLRKCERLFGNASRSFRQVVESAHARPALAGQAAYALVREMTDDLGGEHDLYIRLLSEDAGEGASMHAINVTVISLLLARACGLDESELSDVGIGALLHDVGKIHLPDRLRYHNEHLTVAEQQIFQDHVRYGVEIGNKMRLSKAALLVIGQHHESADGSGYPAGIDNERASPAARIVSLVNHYDNLCNPNNPALALTPYEAIAHIFVQRKHCFDGTTLGLFVRMMGVYPPGSVVELSDRRYALVVSVNASRPLKPRVIVHDPAIPRDDALILDLAHEPALGIRRSLRPLQLPKAAIDYLSPRQRICYFFERGRSAGETRGEA
jgi:putative nucleotidyltransferase with HDIG domain